MLQPCWKAMHIVTSCQLTEAALQDRPETPDLPQQESSHTFSDPSQPTDSSPSHSPPEQAARPSPAGHHQSTTHEGQPHPYPKPLPASQQDANRLQSVVQNGHLQQPDLRAPGQGYFADDGPGECPPALSHLCCCHVALESNTSHGGPASIVAVCKPSTASDSASCYEGSSFSTPLAVLGLCSCVPAQPHSHQSQAQHSYIAKQHV